jgi:PPM family protein phosphatase
MKKNQHIDQLTFHLVVGKATDKGAVRRQNEDSLLALELGLTGGNEAILAGLFAVADGVGGNEGGEIASSTALRVLSFSTVKALMAPSTKMRKDGITPKAALKILRKSAQMANREVYKRAVAINNDMGTTLAAVLVAGNTACIVNAGDSRVYLFDGKALEPITHDHSLVAELVAAGEITTEEIYNHPQRNIITRCLGVQPDLEMDQFTREIRPGTGLVICSDGLWEMVREGEMGDIIWRAESPQAACDELIAAANRNGGRDNISVIIVKAAKWKT